MENSENRPRANPDPPQLNESRDILKKLLDIEINRLDVAVRIEKERNIVFPETTVIIRDIQKLQEALSGKKNIINNQNDNISPREKRSYRGTMKEDG